MFWPPAALQKANTPAARVLRVTRLAAPVALRATDTRD